MGNSIQMAYITIKTGMAIAPVIADIEMVMTLIKIL